MNARSREPIDRHGYEGAVLDSAGEKAGPVVIVTGASSGIGRALAFRLATTGYRVGLIARRRELIEAAASEIVAAGGIGRRRGCRRRRSRRAPRGHRRDRKPARPDRRDGRQRGLRCADPARSA